MNNLFILLGIEAWKPIVSALILPPVPFLLLVLIGARLILPRRGLGWFVTLVGLALLWLSACSGTARLLSEFVLHVPPALSADRIAALKAEAQARPPSAAIVVLGGGMEPYAPEYAAGNLAAPTLERLRYGIWLARRTGLPIAFSGGVGWAQPDATPEARIAGEVAAREFNHPIQWLDEDSRDTRENAGHSVALLKRAGVTHIVLVTHGWHMPRALRAFREAGGDSIRIDAAPMGLAEDLQVPLLRWIPSSGGFVDVRSILRELIGRGAGA